MTGRLLHGFIPILCSLDSTVSRADSSRSCWRYQILFDTGVVSTQRGSGLGTYWQMKNTLMESILRVLKDFPTLNQLVEPLTTPIGRRSDADILLFITLLGRVDHPGQLQ